jgi:PAS domain S-box-containing protein
MRPSFPNGEQQHLQLELEASRRRLALAHASARSGSFEFDIRTGLSTWSPELEDLYGITRGGYRGTREEWAARVHPEDLPQALRDIEAAITGGTFMSGWRIVLPDGRVRHIHAQGRTWPDENGRPAVMAGVNIDVTERHQAQASLSAAERRLEIALEAARMGRWHLDLATLRMDCSPTCKANFGRLPHEKFDYEDVVASVHPEDRAGMQQAVRRAIEEGRELATEYRVTWPDGTVRWIAARGRATCDAQGRGLVMDGVTIDFTGRKRLEEELREKTASLQDADRRKDQFLAVLGHELRNPMAPMRNALTLMQMQGENAAVRDQALAVMDRQMTQLLRLVDELLDVSRIAQGKVRLERRPVALIQLLRDAAEAAEPLMRQRRHAFRIVAPAGDIALHVDRVRIVQVLTNLLNNAAKYTNDGGEIELAAEVAGGVVAVTVKDNGLGIAPESRAKLFELFSQVDASLHRADGGLGLGLNVARRLVEMHDGAIAVHSDGIGRGSVFTVTLPAASSSAACAGSMVRSA